MTYDNTDSLTQNEIYIIGDDNIEDQGYSYGCFNLAYSMRQCLCSSNTRRSGMMRNANTIVDNNDDEDQDGYEMTTG